MKSVQVSRIRLPTNCKLILEKEYRYNFMKVYRSDPGYLLAWEQQ